MKHILLAALLVLTPGCMRGYISAENTHDSVVIVLDRHDKLLNENPPRTASGTVDEPKLASQLRSSAMIRAVYDEALKETQDPDAVSTEDQDPPVGPCNWGTGPCGCDPITAPCTMPCSGCCGPKGCAPPEGRR